VIRNRPKLVHSTVLVDPIVFMLHEPDVSFNVLYRVPTTLTQWILHTFAARELHISHVLMRAFDWCGPVAAVEARSPPR